VLGGGSMSMEPWASPRESVSANVRLVSRIVSGGRMLMVQTQMSRRFPSPSEVSRLTSTRSNGIPATRPRLNLATCFKVPTMLRRLLRLVNRRR